MGPLRAFLIHVFHRHRREGTVLYAIGRLETGETFGLVDNHVRPLLYVRISDRERVHALAGPLGVSLDESPWTTMDGEPVMRASCSRLPTLRKLADRLSDDDIRTYEADVTLGRQYMMNFGVRGAVTITGARQPGKGVDWVYIDPQIAVGDWEPPLAVLSLDIETNEEATEVYAVSLVGTGHQARHQTEEIHIVGEAHTEDPPNLICHPTEGELLKALAERIRAIDPDVLTGWNIVDFDLPVLQRRFRALKLEFNLGRTLDSSWYQAGEVWGSSRMTVYGRQVLDALHLVRATLQRYDDYRLDTVARAILGRGKTLEADDETTMPEAIMHAYRDDRQAFCEYCLEDSRLVRDLLEAEGLVELSLRRSMLTGLPLQRAWGSIAAFEFLYISELHRRGIVAPTTGVDRPTNVGAPGGLVMTSQGGLYHYVFVFDFKSLYPSIMRTFNIDPLAHVRATQAASEDVIRAPNGAEFVREPGILPAMLETFFVQREQAKADHDALASFTYKIVMNSFYGVLAANSCRFASGRLAGAITEFGQYILRWAWDLLEREGLHVLYGDTDSLFVASGLPDDVTLGDAQARGQEICAQVNAELAEHVRKQYGVESHLELEFEKTYKRFLLPSIRGSSDRARAKGYAGLRIFADGEELEIVGMEAVRRDWTKLAHDLQRGLLSQLFHDTPTQEIERSVTDWIRALRAGEKDDDLIYRKSLRKPISSYTSTTPPHVKAAKLLKRPSGVIQYVMTTAGPQPVGHVSAPLDYSHYVDKQIEPIVRTIAQVCHLDVDAAVRGERGLFPC